MATIQLLPPPSLLLSIGGVTLALLWPSSKGPCEMKSKPISCVCLLHFITLAHFCFLLGHIAPRFPAHQRAGRILTKPKCTVIYETELVQRK